MDYTKVQAPSLLRIPGSYRCTMAPDRAIGLDCGCKAGAALIPPDTPESPYREGLN
jgi:hypothetical protein